MEEKMERERKQRELEEIERQKQEEEKWVLFYRRVKMSLNKKGGMKNLYIQ